MFHRLVLGAALLLALPLTAAAQNRQDIRICVFTPDGAQVVNALYDTATGESHVVRNGRRVPVGDAYPTGPQHADGAPWYVNNEPIEVGGARYVKYGLPRVVGVEEIARIAHYRQALVFAEVGLPAGPPDVVYVAVRQGCEVQAYQREITPEEPDAPAESAVEEIAIGQTRSGTLSADDPVIDDGSHYRLYRFTAVAGQEYAVTMASEDFDTFLVVGTMDGEAFESIRANDDGPEMGTDSQVVFTAPASGTFIVRANSLRGGETGRYTLRIERR